MKTYKLTRWRGNDSGASYEENGFVISFPFDPDNTDYQQYLKWLEEGNTPEPAEEQQ